LYITDFLLTGEENAVTGRELCEILNVNIRDLTAQIERERRGGSPICAAQGGKPGYFLAANREEMKRYCGSLDKREKELAKTRKACEGTIDNLPEA